MIFLHYKRLGRSSEKRNKKLWADPVRSDRRFFTQRSRSRAISKTREKSQGVSLSPDISADLYAPAECCSMGTENREKLTLEQPAPLHPYYMTPTPSLKSSCFSPCGDALVMVLLPLCSAVCQGADSKPSCIRWIGLVESSVAYILINL